MEKKGFTLAIGFITLIALSISGYMIYAAPIEPSMGLVQKIMYIHVPSIWVTFIAFSLVCLCSVGYLWKRSETYDIIASSSAEIGVVFCGICLLTGAIWGKPTWNTYWTWDARLTTTLILFLMFVGYLLLRNFMDYGEERAKYSAILGIISCVDIPLIHQSVTWFRTLHQPSTMFSTKKDTISPEFANVLWVSFAAFSILYLYILLKRIALEKETRLYNHHIANLG